MSSGQLPTTCRVRQDNPLDVGDLTTCRYSDEQFPQPADPVPQQIHIMPASERL